MHKQSTSDQNYYCAQRKLGSCRRKSVPQKSDKKTHFADDKMYVGTERLAAVGGCFLTPYLIARRGVKYALEFNCR